MEKIFRPSYIWPNKSFPFRLYFDDKKLRIFIIENLQHNFSWIEQYRHKFRPTDFFIVILGCNYHEWLIKEASKMFDALNLNRINFYILFNDERQKKAFIENGFQGKIINQNAWIDERSVMRPLNLKKVYKAIYVARLISLKRHSLCSSLENLALVAGNSYRSNQLILDFPYDYLNKEQLTPYEVCTKINESMCGLILSESEGACFASSEYLLCGIPVVSTKSVGGRDVWYNTYNSRVVEPDPLLVKEAVDFFNENPRNSAQIRRSHIDQATIYRNEFVILLTKIFETYGIDNVDAREYFETNFFHKMRLSFAPDFEAIFN